MKFTHFTAFQEAVHAMDPSAMRLLIKYRHASGVLVLKATDGAQGRARCATACYACTALARARGVSAIAAHVARAAAAARSSRWQRRRCHLG